MDANINDELPIDKALDRLIFNMGRWSRGIDELAREIDEYEQINATRETIPGADNGSDVADPVREV